jgi:DNA-binding NtrC family response regulator
MTEHKKFRVLIVDDIESHLQKFKRHLDDAFDADPNLFGGARPTIDTDSDARNVESIIESSGEFPYDIIIADVFMPLDPDKSTEPDAAGGVVRIYHAIKKAQLHEKVFLVAMTNRSTEAQKELGEILADHNKNYETPWLITQYPKPATTPGPAPFEQLLKPDDWKYAIGRAIGHCKDREWKMTFVRATLQEIVGNSTVLTKAKLDAERYADHPGRIVLLTGETGSGKELIAQALHWHSKRCQNESKGKVNPQNYAKVNCNVLVPTLVKSELFGHIKGAFTGAEETKKGYFDEFRNGTIFLDEFGEDPVVARNLDLLLRRVLSEPRTFQPVGGTTDIQFDGMVILGGSGLAAFLELETTTPDFLSRVGDVPRINVPPLRERRDDIIPLAKFFLARACDKIQIPTKEFSKEAKSLLVKYYWPGNVRELENNMTKIASKLTRVIGLEELDELQNKMRSYASHEASTSNQPDPIPAEVIAALAEARWEKADAARKLFKLPPETSYEGRGGVQTFVKKLNTLITRYSNDPNFASKLQNTNLRSGRRKKK